MSDSLDGMNAKHQKNDDSHTQERGNALVYVLIVIALFAALSFTVGRQTDTSEVSSMSEEKAELLATQLMGYASQARQVIEQMSFTGTNDLDDYDFILPSDAAFNTAPNFDKVYHPEGGGLIAAKLPPEAISQSGTDPVAGWYMGRFNNVEWTTTTGTDIILVAYQIKREVCEQINEVITGSTTIPTMTDSIKETMIDDALYSAGINVDLTTDGGDICPECDERPMLCVQNQAEDAYGFYSVLAQR